jgi:hypothetical protein
MNQARNDDDGAYDNGWYQDDQQLPPSLGVWPLGRTYVHSSDGALNTGPSGNGHGSPSANGHGPMSSHGHGGPGANGHGAPSRNGHGPPSANGRGGPAPAHGGSAPMRPAQGPGGRPALYPVEGGYRDDPWPADHGSDADHIAEPPFTGAIPDGSTPLYERLALYERYGGPPPADPAPPRSGRPPLYRVGGKYRGDDWPTDPGFRRGDLGLDDFRDDSAPDLGVGLRRPDPGYDPRYDAGFGPALSGPEPADGDPGRAPAFGGPDPSYGGQRRDPGLGGPDPGYGEPRRDAGQGWHGAGRPESAAYADPAPYPPRGYDDGHGRGARGYDPTPGQGSQSARHRGAPPPAPGPAGGYDAGVGESARRPEHPERQRDPEPVTRIRPEGTGQAPGRQGRETWERNVTPAARVAAVEDAKLLAFIHELIQRLKTVPSVYPRLVFLVFGYAAITSLAFAYAEAIPLPITASLVVIPAVGVIYNMGMRYPDWGRRALVGWISGIVATIIYDCLRLALVKVGIWGDPIPGIGRLVFADPHANFAWGYFWRFAGNGGGMGIAYAMLPWRGIRTGVAYGTLICTGLVALLFFFPVAQVHFFPLTPVTTVGAYAGHWVYGAVLGKLTSWWLPPVELGRIHGRLTARLIHPGHRPRPSHARAAGAADDLRRAAARRSA